MINFLKDWITKIAALLIVFTAMQILVPTNTFKKYVNFVFGLLLTYVMISPVLTLLSSDFNAPEDLFKSYYVIDKDLQRQRSDSVEKTMESSLKLFETNLQKVVIDFLKEKYPSNDYEVQILSKYKDEIITIAQINVHIFPLGVKPVESIEIFENSQDIKSNGYENIINSISEEFNVDELNINIIEG